MGATRDQDSSQGRAGLPPDSVVGACGPIGARLCDAAIELAGSEGIESLSDARLAAAAGVDVDAVRRRFGDALGCLAVAYDGLVDRLGGIWTETFAACEDFTEAVARSVVGVLEHMHAHPTHARVVYCEVLRGGHELRSCRDQRRAAHVEWLAEQWDTRRCVPLPATQLELLSGAIFQLMAHSVEPAQQRDLAEIRSEILDVMAVFEPAVAV